MSLIPTYCIFDCLLFVFHTSNKRCVLWLSVYLSVCLYVYLYILHIFLLCVCLNFLHGQQVMCALTLCLSVYLSFFSISLTYTSSCFGFFCIFYMGNNVGVLWGVTHLADAPSSKIHALVFQQKNVLPKTFFCKSSFTFKSTAMGIQMPDKSRINFFFFCLVVKWSIIWKVFLLTYILWFKRWTVWLCLKYLKKCFAPGQSKLRKVAQSYVVVVAKAEKWGLFNSTII